MQPLGSPGALWVYHSDDALEVDGGAILAAVPASLQLQEIAVLAAIAVKLHPSPALLFGKGYGTVIVFDLKLVKRSVYADCLTCYIIAPYLCRMRYAVCHMHDGLAAYSAGPSYTAKLELGWQS